MSYFSYKITRDYGFAPNPFFGYCTLACCKPHIRNTAQVGDWIFGTGSVENHLLYRLIYIMKVEEKLDFHSYWQDPRFLRKRPVLNGSRKQMHGDNIYYKEGGKWHQVDSHHSYPNGIENTENLDTDLSGKYVLISKEFMYWGNRNFLVPQKYKSICCNLRDYCKIKDTNLAEEFVEFLKNEFPLGVLGKPVNWAEYNQMEMFL